MMISMGYESVFIADFMSKEEALAEGYVKQFRSPDGDVYGKGNIHVLCQ